MSWKPDLMIPKLDIAAAEAAAKRQAILTKPTGSMGRLEDLSVQLAGITGKTIPEIEPPRIFVFAGDHGVAWAHPVSAYPPEVTAQMVLNFANRGAVINALARQIGADVVVVDAGVAGYLLADADIVHGNIRAGTRDWTVEAAMTPDETDQAIGLGIKAVSDVEEIGLACIGEMGIGNTTTAAALACALLGIDPEEIVGRGTGLDDAALAKKIEIVRMGLALHADAVASGDPAAILAALGGYEIAAMVGAIFGAAARRIPVIVDGFISSVAALVAVRMEPKIEGYLIASHRSAEQGHGIVLDALGLKPLLDLGLRLGEASGAALAVPLVRAAVAVLRETATFEEAAVSNKG